MTIEDMLNIVNKLGGASFATLLAIILWASWREIWVWSRDVTRLTVRYEALLVKAEEQTNWWRSIAVKATGIAELQGSVAQELAKKTAADAEGRHG